MEPQRHRVLTATDDVSDLGMGELVPYRELQHLPVPARQLRKHPQQPIGNVLRIRALDTVLVEQPLREPAPPLLGSVEVRNRPPRGAEHPGVREHRVAGDVSDSPPQRRVRLGDDVARFVLREHAPQDERKDAIVCTVVQHSELLYEMSLCLFDHPYVAVAAQGVRRSHARRSEAIVPPASTVVAGVLIQQREDAVRETITALAGILAIPVATAPSAHAAPGPGVRATYNGRTINLADGWQGAHACGVFGPDNVRCFDTRAELHDTVVAAARAGTTPAVNGAGTLSSCGGSSTEVQLFSGTNWSGDQLIFVSTSGFFDLADYGFDNDMESWASSKTCNAFVADGTGGGGSVLTLGAESYSLNAGSWKNRASSISVVF